MKLTIKEMTEALEQNRDEIMARQEEILASLPEKYRNRRCRNGGTHGGWTVPGVAAWTRAVVSASGFETDHYWSGSNPTPSTQYPIAVAEFLEKITSREK